MSRQLIVVLLILAASLPVNAMTGSELRREFDSAVNDEDKAVSLLSRLDGLAFDPVHLAYHAATTALLAKFSYNPWNKYSYCKQSMSEFQEAVKAAPANIEIRYLRYCVQSNLPSFLGMNKELSDDRTIMLLHLNESSDQDLNKRIASLLLDTKKCSSAEQELLHKYL
jgi:hypothetical protein